ncbi:MAG TPA: hypothetical protein VIM79_26085 [Niastella sp.]
MKNYRILFFFLLLAACGSDPKPQTADVLPAQENKPDSAKVEDPDTALATFFYRNYKNFNAEAQMSEYKRWDLEHEKIKPLLVNLYLKGNDKDPVLITLEKNRQAFHDKAVTAVLDDYKRLHSLSGQWFTYLVEKKDEMVLPLLQDLLKDPKAPGTEKEYALTVLKNWKGNGGR